MEKPELKVAAKDQICDSHRIVHDLHTKKQKTCVNDPFKEHEFVDEFLFPIKIFLDSNHDHKHDNKDEDETKFQKKIKFKVMIIYNKTFKYTDQSNAVSDGYPWSFIDLSM
jgi:hypothetical protein